MTDIVDEVTKTMKKASQDAEAKYETRQDKTRQDKTRQDKTRQDKTMQRASQVLRR